MFEAMRVAMHADKDAATDYVADLRRAARAEPERLIRTPSELQDLLKSGW